MKLLTARVADDYRLHIETPTGFVDVDAAATLADEPALHGLMDVGALLRADDTVRAALARAGQHLARAWQPLPARPLEALTLAPPILAPSKIICVGHNYRAHVAEGGAEIPAEPLLFAKCANALIGHGDQILYPSITTQLDYEGELAIIIGRRASRVPESRAMDYVAGFTIMNDISARDLQHGVSQWFYGKSLDTFAPLGPCVVTVDAAGPYASMRLQTRVNGELRQDSSCGDMIFGPEQLIAFIARDHPRTRRHHRDRHAVRRGAGLPSAALSHRRRCHRDLDRHAGNAAIERRDEDRPMMGRGVVITGGAGDLGAAMGVELARRGAMVTLIDAKSSAEAAPWVDPVRHAGPDVAYVQADVRDHEAIRAALAAVDPLDVAIGNAGIGVMTDFLDVSVEDWRHHVDVNLHGCFNLGQSAARLMVARRRPGVIIFTGTWIQDVPWPGMSAYCATKSGIKMLAQCMARELAPHGIRVNIIAPGIVNAGPTRRRLETNADFARHAARVIPLDQLQTPEQVAVATAFLCSADASYMTGATLLVDGGCSLFRFE